MAAPAGLSGGSAPEPPETTDPELVATKQVTTEPTAAEPVAAEPTATEPVAAEPVTTAPVAAQPAGTEPAAAQPAGTEFAAQPAGTEPFAAQPVTPEPVSAQPTVMEPVATDSVAAEPTAAEPVAAQPTATEPVAAQPVAAEPVGRADEEGTGAALDPDRGPADAEPAESTDEVRHVSPLAVAALVLGVIALVGVAVGVLAVVTHGFRPKTIVTYRTPAAFRLREGDCINSAPNGLSVTVLSCATAHDAEVFATFRLTGSSWPGGAIVQQEAGDGCLSRLGGYLNPQLANAGFAQEYVYPDWTAWQAGIRTVVCEIRASTGQLTGSVRKRG